MAERSASESGWRFAGRNAELSLLSDAWQSAVNGSGRLVLLAGEPGIGKSRLIGEFCAGLLPQEARVLWGHCHEDSGAPPYWPWIQVLRTYVRDTPRQQFLEEASGIGEELGRIVPELRSEPAARRNAEIDDAYLRFRLLDSAAVFFRRASATRPLVLALDDLHNADESSLTLLRFLARELRSMHVLVLAAYRDGDARLRRPLMQVLADLARESSRVNLVGFTEEEVAAAVPSMPRAAVTSIHQVTGGNPLFISELTRAAAADGWKSWFGEGAAWRVPDTISEVLRRRWGDLPERTVKLLRLAAVAGQDFDLNALQRLDEVLEPASATHGRQLLEELTPGLEAGIIAPSAAGRFAFTHALLREVLRGELSPSRRIEVHRILVETLRGSPHASAAEIAHHAYQTAAFGGAEQAVEHCEGAGHAALQAFAFEEAAEHFARAIDAQRFLPGGEANQYRLLMSLAEAQRLGGDMPRATETYLRAAAVARQLPSATPFAQAAFGVGRSSETGVPDPVKLGLMEEALGRLGEEEVEMRARLLARLAMGLYFTGDRVRGRELSLQAVTLARGTRALPAALVCRHFALWEPGTTAERLALTEELIAAASQAGDQEMEMEGRLWRLCDLVECGDAATYRQESVFFARRAESMRLPLYRYHFAVSQGMRLLARGRFSEAEEHVWSTLAMGHKYNISRADQIFGAQMFHVWRGLGKAAELEPILRVNAERFPALPVWRCALALVHAECGRAAEASAAVELLAGGAGPVELPSDGNWLPSVALLAEVCARTGGPGVASRLYEQLLPYSGQQVVLFDSIATLGPVDYSLGLLARTAGAAERAAEHFAAALDLSQRWEFDHYSALAAAGGGAPGTPAQPAVIRAPSRGAVFRNEGAFWRVAFGGVESLMKASRGLLYLSHLLRHAGREFHALDLATLGSGGGDDASGSRERSSAPELHVRQGGDAGAMLDARAKAEYRERLRELREDLEEARQRNDVGHADRLQEEIELLTRELSRAVGLGGRDRMASSDAERARIAVTKAILQALKAIAEENEPLHRHLKANLKTGRFCAYSNHGAEVEWLT